MDYKIVQKEAFTIIEKVSFHSIEDGANSKTVSAFLDVVSRKRHAGVFGGRKAGARGIPQNRNTTAHLDCV